jgi:two-component system KDP operon response regulator KdpE
MRERQPCILAVSHQPALWDGLKAVWKEPGILAVVARDRATAVRCVRDELPDLVLLDVDLADRDAFALLRQVRAVCTVGIIAITERADEQEKIRGLELGADDYVIKPFSPSELAARIHAVLRRTAARLTRGTELVRVDERLQIDFHGRDVIVAGQRRPLRPTEYRLLHHLVEHAGQTLSFENILAHVWGPEYREESNYVHLYVTYLRQKLEADPSRPRYILTRRGMGYRFCALP